MIIGNIFFPVKVLGWGNRLGIWTCGCKKSCKGCISPELKDINNGYNCSVDKLDEYIKKIDKNIDGVTISGGEPFDQIDELLTYVEYFVKKGLDDILIYTGYRYEELIGLNEKAQMIIDNVAAIVDGPYDIEKNDGYGQRGSCNQKLHVMKYHERYIDFEKKERSIQGIVLEDRIVYIGIPG